MLNRHAAIALILGVMLLVPVWDAHATFLPGEFVTYSQDAWGAAPSPGNAAQLLQSTFDTFYTGGLEVGVGGSAGFSMTFTSAAAVEDYLPGTGTPGPLTADLVDPTSSGSGVFGGVVLALQIDVDFSDAGYLSGSAATPFGDLVLVGMSSVDLGTLTLDVGGFDGLTVRQFLAQMNAQLSSGVGSYGFDDAWEITNLVGRAFDGGTPSQFAQDHLVNVPEPSSMALLLPALGVLAAHRRRRCGESLRGKGVGDAL